MKSPTDGADPKPVGRLRGTTHPVWQLTAIDVRSSYAGAELVICPTGHPTGDQTSELARLVAKDLQAAGWRLERVLCDNGREFRSRAFADQVERLGARRTHIHAGRPQTNGNVEALQRTILDECWLLSYGRDPRTAHPGDRDVPTRPEYYFPKRGSR